MLIGPIVFCTIINGIGQHKDLKKAGKISLKAIIYFEIITTFALVFAMLLAHFFEPGKGLVIANSSAESTILPLQVLANKTTTVYQDLLNMIPESLVGSFVDGNLLHILFIAVLLGIALVLMREKGRPILDGVVLFNELLFKLMHVVIKLAPIAVFGSMAFTVSKFGVATLVNLGEVILLVFASCIFFIVFILGLICRLSGLRLLNVLSYIKEEIVLILGTSSSEIALPQLMEKLVKKGCDKEIVALVLPMGYSFNLDGMSIYLGIAVIFIAQVYGIDLSLAQELYIIGFMLLISKGSAGVTGAGFITLTAIITTINVLPVEGLGLLLSIDRFMTIARSSTNMIGNVIATVVIDGWENPHKNKFLIRK